MANTNEENLIVALDIGTSKVVAIVGAVGAVIGTAGVADSGDEADPPPAALTARS